MADYRVKLYIEPNDIYNKLREEDKKRFKHLSILSANIDGTGGVEIECAVFENKPIEVTYRQRLLDDGKIKFSNN